MKKSKLLSLLGNGLESAKTATELRDLLDCKSIRCITVEINLLRNRGHVIASQATGQYRGYFIPNTQDELANYVKTTRGRIREIQRALASAETALGGL